MPDQTPAHVGTKRPLAPATLAVTAGRGPVTPDAPLTTPVVFSSTFHAGGPVAYGRDGNPTWTAFETAIGALEGGTALAFSSGMAAVAAVLETLPIGACVVASKDAYTGTRRFLSDRAAAGRLRVRPVDLVETNAVVAACDGADLVWAESPTNPKLDVADLEAIAMAAKEAGALMVVDNTFATPYLQRPLDLGADVVVHSVTKFLAGHSDTVMGATVTADAGLCGRLHDHRSLCGAVPGPMETFLALRGMRTLAVRIDKAQANAGELARRLAAHPEVNRVRYPGLPTDPGHTRAARQMSGFGAMLSFEVSGGADAAEAVAASVRVMVHATSLGGVETTIERRGRWKGEEATPPSLLRLSVGCEDVDDLWDDLNRALRIACPGE